MEHKRMYMNININIILLLIFRYIEYHFISHNFHSSFTSAYK